MRETLERYPETLMPNNHKPMMPHLHKGLPFDRKGWGFEPKLDGFNCTIRVDRGSVRFRSKDLAGFNIVIDQFAQNFKHVRERMFLISEACRMDQYGNTRLDWLVSPSLAPEASTIRFGLYDVTYFDKYDVKTMPLRDRKQLLYEIVEKYFRDDTHIVVVTYLEEKGTELFNLMKEIDQEGIVAKNLNSMYVEGVTSPNWLKIKNPDYTPSEFAPFFNRKGLK